MNMPSIGARLTKELKSLEVKGDYYYDPQLSTGLAEYKKILSDMNVLNGAYTAYLKEKGTKVKLMILTQSTKLNMASTQHHFLIMVTIV